MTISTLAKLNVANGGFFFSRDTMKHGGETLKSFSLEDHQDGTGTVTRLKDGTTWKFDLNTGRVTHGLRVTIQPRAVTMLHA